MSLAMLAIYLSAGGVIATGALAVLFVRNPASAMAIATHRPEKLPCVMADRYIAFCGLALFATLYGDLNVIAALFGAFAFMGFADAFIYARGGFPAAKHLLAGALALIVTSIALLAQNIG